MSPRKNKQEEAPSPLPFRSESFERDSQRKIERIQRALATADKQPVSSLPEGESLVELESPSEQPVAKEPPADNSEIEVIRNLHKRNRAKEDDQPAMPKEDDQPAMPKEDDQPAVAKEDGQPAVAKEDDQPAVAKESDTLQENQQPEPSRKEKREAAARAKKEKREAAARAKKEKREAAARAKKEKREAAARAKKEKRDTDSKKKVGAPEHKSNSSSETTESPAAAAIRKIHKESKASSREPTLIIDPQGKPIKKSLWGFLSKRSPSEDIPAPKPIRPKRKEHSKREDLFAEEIETLTQEEEALEQELAQQITKEPIEEKEPVEERAPAEEREPIEERPSVQPGEFIARPKEEELVAKRVSSRPLAESAAEREAARAAREAQRQKRRSKRSKAAADQRQKSQKKKTRETWRERSARRREARERARREKAVKEAQLYRANADQHHWTEGLPLLQDLHKWSVRRKEAKDKKQSRPKKKAKVAQLLENYRRNRAAQQARKLWEDIVGLDIGGSYLRAVLVDKGEVVLAEREIPDGIIVRGILEEPEELASEIKSFWKEEEISSSKVNISLANRLTVLKTMEIQAESEDDIKQALALNANTLVEPMKVDDVVIDYAQLSRSGAGTSLQVAAADEDMVTQLVGAVEEAGLVVAGAEIAPLTVTRALRVPRSKDRATVLLDIGSETTDFIVSSGPDVFFLRVLEIGGNDFTRAIAERAKLSWSEAEEIKKNISSYKQNPDVQRALRETADRFCREVAQTEEIYREMSQSRKIEDYIMLGGAARLEGLAEQLQFVLNRTVSRDIHSTPRYDSLQVDLSSWASAIGLASGHSMSLLPSKRGLGSKKRRTSKISSEEAKQRARQLTASSSGTLTSKKMLISLAIAIGLLLTFLWSNSIGTNLDSLRSQKQSLQSLVGEAPDTPQSNPADSLRQSLRALPNWTVPAAALRKAEEEGIEVLEFSALGSTTKLFFRDSRTGEELEEIFATQGSSITVEENSAGEKEVTIEND